MVALHEEGKEGIGIGSSDGGEGGQAVRRQGQCRFVVGIGSNALEAVERREEASSVSSGILCCNSGDEGQDGGTDGERAHS